MTPRELELRDEILQVLFWLRGEDLGEAARVDELATWIAAEPAELEPVVGLMLDDGYLDTVGCGDTYTLTPLGLAEGGRRFTENFADAGLGRRAHGACSDDCDCHRLGPEHCAEHRHEHRH